MPQSASATYNPNAEQPYQAYQAPEVAPPNPSPVAPSNPPFQFTGAPISKVGAIAGALDNIFRGYMQGKAQSEVKKAMQIKAKSDNLQASYEQDAKRLYSLAQAGVPKDDPEFKTAVQAVQGSWGALQDWIGSHVNTDDGSKKKSKSKSSQSAAGQPAAGQPQQDTTLQDLQSQDPKVKAAALFKLQQKFGPPVMAQVAQFYTPQAEAARKNASAQANLDSGDLAHQGVIQTARAKIDELNKKPQAQWTPEDWTSYNQAQQQIEPRKPGDEAKIQADEILRRHAGKPDAPFTEAEKETMRAAGWKIDANLKHQVTRLGEIIEFDEEGNPTVLRPSQPEYQTHGRGGSGGGAGKNSPEAVKAKLKEAFPDASDEEIENMARQKMFGKNIASEGNLASLASSKDPAKQQQFDSAILDNAVTNLRGLADYKEMPDFDDALANILGKDEEGQYHYRPYVAAARKDGGYSGNVSLMDTKDSKTPSLQKMERDLQRLILTAVTQAANKTIGQGDRAAALRRMAPIVGKAPSTAGSGPAASPQPQAAQPGAAASSPSPSGASAGGDKPKKRTIYQHGVAHSWVELTDDEAKQLANDSDFKAQGGTIK